MTLNETVLVATDGWMVGAGSVGPGVGVTYTVIVPPHAATATAVKTRKHNASARTESPLPNGVVLRY
jgi:hypothetical protein